MMMMMMIIIIIIIIIIIYYLYLVFLYISVFISIRNRKENVSYCFVYVCVSNTPTPVGLHTTNTTAFQLVSVNKSRSWFPREVDPVVLAIRRGDVEALHDLTVNQSLLTLESPDGWTALHEAARCGQTEAVRMILEGK